VLDATFGSRVLGNTIFILFIAESPSEKTYHFAYVYVNMTGIEKKIEIKDFIVINEIC